MVCAAHWLFLIWSEIYLGNVRQSLKASLVPNAFLVLVFAHIFAYIIHCPKQADLQVRGTVLCDELTIPVLVGEEFKEAPDLFRHAGVALHE